MTEEQRKRVDEIRIEIQRKKTPASKVTIEELETILNSEDCGSVTILPDGTIDRGSQSNEEIMLAIIDEQEREIARLVKELEERYAQIDELQAEIRRLKRAQLPQD